MTAFEATFEQANIGRAMGRIVRARVLRDPRIVIAGTMLAIVFGLAIFASTIEPSDPNRMSAAILQGPSWSHLMGTDQFGRDQLSRVIAGSRVSVTIAVTVAAISMAVGLPFGLLLGFLRGRLDFVAGRVLDVMFAFPGLLLALIFAGVFGPGLKTAAAALSVIYIAPVTRFVRGLVIAERDRDYVTAARVAGASPVRIMTRHVLPNIASPLLVLASFVMSVAVLLEAALSYLGVGVQPPTASWGRMLTENAGYVQTDAYLIVFPGLAIVWMVFALNLLGDGLRDFLDPRQRKFGGARGLEPIP